MAFTIFTNSTTAYANEVHDNFIYIGQGNIFPMINSSTMGVTDNSYYLGSSQYKWNYIYANYLQSIQSIINPSWIMIAEIDTAARVELSYDFHLYKEILVFTNATPFYFNGDSDGSHYIYSMMFPDGSSNVIATTGSASATSTIMRYISFISNNNNSISFVNYQNTEVTGLYIGRYTLTNTLTSIVFLPGDLSNAMVFVR